MPITDPIRIASPASSSVIGSRCTIVCATGSSRWSVPRSPRTARLAQLRYWIGNGRSRPYLWRIAATRAGSRFSAPRAVAGSPGIARTPAKTSMLASTMTIRAAPTLRRRKLPMIARTRPLLLEARELHAHEPVAEELDASDLLGLRVAVDHVVEVDHRPVLCRLGERRVERDEPRWERRRLPFVRQRTVDDGVRVPAVVLRAGRVEEAERVAVRVDAARPTDREGLELAAVL